jgi:uncharacterized membrane protein YczE
MILRRLAQLYAGLILYGVSMALMVRPDLGLDPWDVFHQGVTRHVGLSFGTVVILTGAAVLLLWVPLRQKPGIGTVSNVIVIGIAADAALALLGTPQGYPARFAMLIAGIVLNGVATGAYMGARLGPGPRDGLMMGLVGRTGLSVRLIRTTIELSALAVGWLLGGTAGIGTVLYAVSIGWLIQLFLPWFTIDAPARRPFAQPS